VPDTTALTDAAWRKILEKVPTNPGPHGPKNIRQERIDLAFRHTRPHRFGAALVTDEQTELSPTRLRECRLG